MRALAQVDSWESELRIELHTPGTLEWIGSIRDMNDGTGRDREDDNLLPEQVVVTTQRNATRHGQDNQE